MNDVLKKICTDTMAETARRKTTTLLSFLEEKAKQQPPARGFARALDRAASSGRYGLIAEIKRASPSRGAIRPNLDPATIARAYAEGGATCLSVLTDKPYFGGEAQDLIAARDAVTLPVLRKDFILDPYQVIETRAMGADCLLLIMAALSDTQARELGDAAQDMGLDILIEVHNEAELARGLTLPFGMIGINNRDLRTLKIDLATTERLAPLVPKDRLLVAESGLYHSDDLARLAKVGARAFLVGESLMRQDDVAHATRTLLGLSPAA